MWFLPVLIVYLYFDWMWLGHYGYEGSNGKALNHDLAARQNTLTEERKEGTKVIMEGGEWGEGSKERKEGVVE